MVSDAIDLLAGPRAALRDNPRHDSRRAIGKEEHAGSVRTQGLTQAFYYFHSPCSMNAAQKYGDDQRFSFINSICAERRAAAGRRPSFNIDS